MNVETVYMGYPVTFLVDANTNQFFLFVQKSLEEEIYKWKECNYKEFEDTTFLEIKMTVSETGMRSVVSLCFAVSSLCYLRGRKVGKEEVWNKRRIKEILMSDYYAEAQRNGNYRVFCKKGF